MNTKQLPSRNAMIQAFQSGDVSYDGVFLTGVKTTGIFCRPVCPARKPRVENVIFFPTVTDALHAGFRPCKRCRPLEAEGTPPEWLRPLLDEIEADPSRRWRAEDLRTLGLSPDRVRRWFQTHHGMTFHAYSRARRLGAALGQIQHGQDVTGAALDSGYESLSGFHDAFRKILGRNPSRARRGSVVTVTRIPTPLGPFIAGATATGLCLLEFPDRRMLETQLRTLEKRLDCVFVPGSNAILDDAAAEIDDYFAGRRRKFTVPLDTPGTPFQQEVWAALRKIPYGKTVSYGELAASIGRPTAMRAVARANGENRLAVIIPCHRVIGADGSLTGYGGGVWRKQRLLDLESGVEPESPTEEALLIPAAGR